MRALMKSEKARKIIRRTSTNIIPQIPPFAGARFQIDGFSKGQKVVKRSIVLFSFAVLFSQQTIVFFLTTCFINF
jgi:hypothetical protein